MNNQNNAVFIRGLIHLPPEKNKPDLLARVGLSESLCLAIN